MRNNKGWLLILLLGSIWGIVEVIIGEFLYNQDLPYGSVILSFWALFILAFGRGIANAPGSSTLISLIACLFKLANASPFYCHLLGILFIGFSFDIFFTICLRRKKKFDLIIPVIGAFSSYGGNALFALVITYVIRYEFWTREGLPKVINHIFIKGTLTSLAAIFLVPLGFWLGLRLMYSEKSNFCRIHTGAVTALAVLWIVAAVSRFL